jgi:hypothetical protein
MRLTQKFLEGLAKSGALNSTEIRAAASGLQVIVKIRGSDPLTLVTDRGQTRSFKSWTTCMRYLRSIGITRVTVEMAQWESDEKEKPLGGGMC